MKSTQVCTTLCMPHLENNNTLNNKYLLMSQYICPPRDKQMKNKEESLLPHLFLCCRNLL